MKEHSFLAFDLGATSGRSIVGTLKDGKLQMQELTRFPNGPVRSLDKDNRIDENDPHLYWDVLTLSTDVSAGFRACADAKITPSSVGIDSWGVDFGLFGKSGKLLTLPYSYRDPYTNGMPEKFFELVPRREVYNATGIQVMSFNSLYQLFALKQSSPTLIEATHSLLFIPDMLAYVLTKKQRNEFTLATTSQLFNPRTMAWEEKLFGALGIPVDIMQPIVMPGEVIGDIKDRNTLLTGIAPIPVVAVGTHDTASAVFAVPSPDKNFAYLSSGTWSLMGIECDEPIISDRSYQLNFTNEGGVGGSTRFLKNITGMWLLERCKAEWASRREYAYPEMVDMAKAEQPFRFFVDPDAPEFANPLSMTEAIAAHCAGKGQPAPVSDAEFVRCIFDSLAMKYRYTLDMLKGFAPHPIARLHVIGGGAKNALLNQLTANAIGLPVVAGPSEATAIGNIMVQAMAAGCVKSADEAREVIRASVQPETYTPQDSDAWSKAFEKLTQQNFYG
ncbi:MAG: rhamnulokinase [Prevotellaceae bacterium]|jgi:rhamnulokinase|nr:rhamnulokinase [Prevotellaceae bacterium]